MKLFIVFVSLILFSVCGCARNIKLEHVELAATETEKQEKILEEDKHDEIAALETEKQEIILEEDKHDEIAAFETEKQEIILEEDKKEEAISELKAEDIDIERIPETETEEMELLSGPVDEEKETESIINVITALEKCYKTYNFGNWKRLLTKRYKEKYSNAKNLKKEGWPAKDLYSFFKLLVKTRRASNISSLSISRVEFVSPNKAYVYVILGDEEFPEPQHTFLKIDDSWYKGLRDEF